MAKRSRDFTTGSPAKQLLIFALPLIASMILQNLYNTADAVIVGRFVGQTALAAVGAAGSLTRVIPHVRFRDHPGYGRSLYLSSMVPRTRRA